jgi:hypothetical protein
VVAVSLVDLDLIVVRPRDQVTGATGSRFNRRDVE